MVVDVVNGRRASMASGIDIPLSLKCQIVKARLTHESDDADGVAGCQESQRTSGKVCPVRDLGVIVLCIWVGRSSVSTLRSVLGAFSDYR